MADSFEPSDYQEQYRDRIKFVREEGLAKFQSRFERTELDLRRMICEMALGLEVEEIKIVERASA
jgi:hypothetical protein